MLTAKRVQRLKTAGRYRDGLVAGLYLQVSDRGAKSWVLRFELNGRERMMGLGPAAVFTLKEARARAISARQQLVDGIDPLSAKQGAKAAAKLAAAKTITFAEAAQSFVDQNEPGWRNARHARQVIDTLKEFAFPILGALPVGAIDTALVLKVLEQKVGAQRGRPAGAFWTVRSATASRVRGRIEAVLSWATVRGYRQGDNPARWRGHLDQVLPAREAIAKVEHYAALPFTQMAEFVADLRTREGVAAKALEFTIVTAARTGEVMGARWCEIEGDVWSIPAGRMKAGKAHRVPLSERALQILSEVPTEEGNDHVFIGSNTGAGLSNMAMNGVLKRMGRDGITVHGFRSCFRDWAAEQTNFPNHVVEMALAHVVGDKVEAAYRRGDLFAKRKQLMDAWAAYCSRQPVKGETVVPMRGRR